MQPSLMSNDPIITRECKQEKTLHTDMGLILDYMFVVVLQTTGSFVCFMWVCAVSGSCTSSNDVNALGGVVSAGVKSKPVKAHNRRFSC